MTERHVALVLQLLLLATHSARHAAAGAPAPLTLLVDGLPLQEVDSAPSLSIGPPEITTVGNITEVADDACAPLSGGVCAPERDVALLLARDCSFAAVARHLLAAGCRAALTQVAQDPPGLGLTFEELRENRDAAIRGPFQLHGLSRTQFRDVRRLVAGGAGVAARLVKSPEVVAHNAWRRMDSSVAYRAAVKGLMPAIMAGCVVLGLVRLVEQCVRGRARAGRSWRSGTHCCSISELPLAPSVILLETVGFSLSVVRAVLISWRSWSALDRLTFNLGITAAMCTASGTFVIIAFWRDAFALASIARQSVKRRCLLLGGLMVVGGAYYAVELLEAGNETHMSLQVFYWVLQFLGTAALLVYGVRVRGVMVKRLAALSLQARAHSTSAKEEELAKGVRKLRRAIYRITVLLAAWNVYLVIFFSIYALSFPTPALLFTARVLYDSAFAFQGLAKLLMFPSAIRKLRGGCIPAEDPQVELPPPTSHLPRGAPTLGSVALDALGSGATMGDYDEDSDQEDAQRRII